MTRDKTIPRASTYQNINGRYSDAVDRKFRFRALETAVRLLSDRLELHKVGAPSVKAADVYSMALTVATYAIALAEHGTEGYPYASHIPTGQIDLPLK